MTGEEIVTHWLLDLWLDRPQWINRMPERKEVEALIEAIDAELDHLHAVRESEAQG